MPDESPSIVALSDMTHGQDADLFALCVSKEQLTTRDGKPYYMVAFRDAEREVRFPIWSDSPLSDVCRAEWTPGEFYKIRAIYRDTNYGPQLDIRKIRPVSAADEADGFDPAMCLPSTRFDSEEMFAELVGYATEKVGDTALSQLVVELLESNRAELLTMPAAKQNHHAFAGGLLEHTLSVVRTSDYLAEKYDDYYPDMQPRLNKDLVIAGAILHDIGKLRELDQQPQGADYTASGHLIGHILQGRDMVREAAAARDLPDDMLLRLEHIIVSHQRLPEWGSPKPPMTPEALLVHYADDMDAKYHMVVAILSDDASSGPITSQRNALHQRLYRGDAQE